MTAEIANNFSWAAMFFMGTSALNVIMVGMLIYMARVNLRLTRTLAGIMNAQAGVTRTGGDGE